MSTGIVIEISMYENIKIIIKTIRPTVIGFLPSGHTINKKPETFIR
ncbi:MAG: hypothetical protein LBL79_11710 [Prevotella sp.]|jgi:hypothetical protein|nr:hypothetical protein [Prevotella sp.]